MLDSYCMHIQGFSVGKGCQAHPAPALAVTPSPCQPKPHTGPADRRPIPCIWESSRRLGPSASWPPAVQRASCVSISYFSALLVTRISLNPHNQPEVRSCGHPESRCEKRASDRGDQSPGTQPQAGLVSPGELRLPASENSLLWGWQPRLLNSGPRPWSAALPWDSPKAAPPLLLNRQRQFRRSAARCLDLSNLLPAHVAAPSLKGAAQMSSSLTPEVTWMLFGFWFCKRLGRFPPGLGAAVKWPRIRATLGLWSLNCPLEGGPWWAGAAHMPGFAIGERPSSLPHMQGPSGGLPGAQDKDTGWGVQAWGPEPQRSRAPSGGAGPSIHAAGMAYAHSPSLTRAPSASLIGLLIPAGRVLLLLVKPSCEKNAAQSMRAPPWCLLPQISDWAPQPSLSQRMCDPLQQLTQNHPNRSPRPWAAHTLLLGAEPPLAPRFGTDPVSFPTVESLHPSRQTIFNECCRVLPL